MHNINLVKLDEINSIFNVYDDTLFLTVCFIGVHFQILILVFAIGRPLSYKKRNRSVEKSLGKLL